MTLPPIDPRSVYTDCELYDRLRDLHAALERWVQQVHEEDQVAFASEQVANDVLDCLAAAQAAARAVENRGFARGPDPAPPGGTDRQGERRDDPEEPSPAAG